LAPYLLKVETATSGFEAIDMVKSGKIYDIIFMDHMMPKMDGIEATQKIRELGYGGPVVALTANALAGNEEMFRRNGLDGFISKPIDIRNMDEFLTKFVRSAHPEEAAEWLAEQIKLRGTGNQDSDDGGKKICAESKKPDVDPKMLEIFRKDAVKAVAAMRETVKSGDLKLYTTTVHAMKSALANVGEVDMSQQARSLEQAGHGGNWGFIGARTDGFIKALEAFLKTIPGSGDVASTDDAGISEDTAYLAEQLKIVKSACDDYDDAGAYKALDRLREKTWRKNTVDTLEGIRDILFLHSDFEEGALRAQNLIERVGG
jgi:CheY-like chemotaxis protein